MRGNVEADFLAMNDRGGKLVFHQILQDQFLIASRRFSSWRGGLQRIRRCDDPERRAHFDGMCHAHAVAFCQDVVGKIVLLIQPKEGSQVVTICGQFAHFPQERVQ